MVPPPPRLNIPSPLYSTVGRPSSGDYLTDRRAAFFVGDMYNVIANLYAEIRESAGPVYADFHGSLASLIYSQLRDSLQDCVVLTDQDPAPTDRR
jgi:hypothetical protein